MVNGRIIKKGDILVANYPNCYFWERKYIIFIAKGISTSTTISSIAHIDLGGILGINMIIGFDYNKDYCYLSKPTVEQYTELIQKLKKNGYQFNKKTKQLITLN